MLKSFHNVFSSYLKEKLQHKCRNLWFVLSTYRIENSLFPNRPKKKFRKLFSFCHEKVYSTTSLFAFTSTFSLPEGVEFSCIKFTALPISKRERKKAKFDRKPMVLSNFSATMILRFYVSSTAVKLTQAS